VCVCVRNVSDINALKVVWFGFGFGSSTFLFAFCIIYKLNVNIQKVKARQLAQYEDTLDNDDFIRK